MYEARNLKNYLVHSEMPEKECRQRLIEFERDGDCVVQVGKLGEGYDHHYLSVAAIFRPLSLPFCLYPVCGAGAARHSRGGEP